MKDLFSEFPPISKADWLRQIEKDLKGKPLEDLNWQLPDGMVVTPFVHADDFQTAPAALSTQANAWEICEDVLVSDPVLANRQAIEALEGGAEGLCFWLDQALEAADFAQLLEGVHLDFIGLHFAGSAVSANPGMVLVNLEGLARQRGLSTTQLRGSLAYDPVPVSKTVDWRYLADLIEYVREHFPGFKIIQVSASESSTDDLAALLRNANIYIQKLSERGIPVADIARFMQVSMPVGKSYFFEIARLRAFKLLWFNLLNAWKAPLASPSVQVHFLPGAYTDDLYTNMIRATTLAMSAVQGGAARLTVLPYDAGREVQATYPQAFSRRIARNVQHLLKMESAMDEVADPSAGSYYVETLTGQLAEKAWAGIGGI
jgi:methylmalonyl-CoA mutase